MPTQPAKKQEAKKQEPTKPDRIDLRLYNAIVIYDVYMVARSPEAARKTLLDAISSGHAAYTEAVVKEVTMANSIRSSWVDQGPYIASDVSDEEFTSLTGITTGAAFERFYN